MGIKLPQVCCSPVEVSGQGVSMTNQEIIGKVNRWQNSVLVHPLTCGNDSRHQVLVPRELDGKVVLVCLDCDYVQDHIPEIVMNEHLDA